MTGTATTTPVTSPQLRDLTTMRIGGDIGEYLEVFDEATLIAAVQAADENGTPVFVLGGGSNVVCSDAPFAGLVIRTADPAERGIVATGAARGINVGCEADLGEADATDAPESTTGILATIDNLVTPGVTVSDASACAGVTINVWAGVAWDAFVAHCVAQNWVGVEALSGIPGTVGATPIQNVGAYGQEAAQVIASVRTWDRQNNAVKTFAMADCEFSYRHSIFKATPWAGSPTGRYVVLAVQFQLRQGTLSAPIRYADLATHLGVTQGERVAIGAARDAVLAVRASKGMVLNPADHDTWSAGSFFTNPLLTPAQAETLPPEAPRHPGGTRDGVELVKTSAAWLISNSGLDKGYGLNKRATLSTKHSLAITNRGGANAADIAELARAVRDTVQAKFGVELVPEPVWVGHSI